MTTRVVFCFWEERKMICTIIIWGMISAMSAGGYAAGFGSEMDHPNAISGYVNVVVDHISQKDILSTVQKQANEYNMIGNDDYMIHNNGKPIESDYFVEGKDEGNVLVAVTLDNDNGKFMEHAYFTDDLDMQLDELAEFVESENVSNRSEAKVSDDVTKKYSWKFTSKSDKSRYSNLSTTLEFHRRSDDTDFNGKSASVWDIESFSQLEQKTAHRINDLYTRLDVDKSAQELISYGPTGSQSGGSASVSLSGFVPTISYDFDMDGFSMKDLSSMSSNYGRWHFYDGFGNVDSFSVTPGVRATNTSGDFVLELSHIAEISFILTSEERGTGVIQVYVSDR